MVAEIKSIKSHISCRVGRSSLKFRRMDGWADGAIMSRWLFSEVGEMLT